MDTSLDLTTDQLPTPDPTPAPTHRHAPVNLSAAIPCDLAGYEGVSVRYVVSRSAHQIAAKSAAKSDVPVLAFLINSFELWPFESPAPVGGDEASFELCDDLGQDLIVWLMRDGYPKAVRGIVGPNS